MKTINISDQTEIEAIINGCEICYVAINEKDAAPYLIPMNFGYQNNVIFLHSAPFGKHLELLKEDNRISITFCLVEKLVYQHVNVACSYRMDSRSVICKGVVTYIEDLKEKETVLNMIMKKFSDKEFTYSLPAITNVKVWKVNLDKITAKAFGQKFLK